MLRIGKVVVNVGREDDFILLHEKARCLESQQEVLAGGHLGRRLADARTVPERPGADAPGRQILRHVKRHLGHAVAVGVDQAIPIGGVGKCLADGWLNRCGTAPAWSPNRLDLGNAVGRHGRGHGLHQDRATLGATERLPSSLGRPVVSGDGVPEDTDWHHGGGLWGAQVVEPAVDVAVLLNRVVAPPLPEEGADIRNGVAAGNIVECLVVHADHAGADNGLVLSVAHTQLDTGWLAGLEVFGGRGGFYAKHAIIGRHEQLAHHGPDFAVTDRQRLDEDVGPVGGPNAELAQGGVSVHAQDPWQGIGTVDGALEQQDGLVGSCRTDQQFGLLAR